MEWRNVVGYEGKYLVSDMGEVQSVPRARTKGGVLKPKLDAYGYRTVTIGGKGRKVHALVLEAFVGPRPPGLMGRHLNGDQVDNRLSNLQWGTKSENMMDAVAHGTHHQASKTHCKWGHAFDEANTMILRTGHRSCRECANARNREYRRNRK